MNTKLTIVLFVSITLILCSAVSAEDLQTTESGVVNGGVYSHSVQDPAYSAQNSGDNQATVQFNITKDERTYNNVNTAPSTNTEKHVKNVSDAVLSTMVYVQGTDTIKSSYVNVSLDGDNDGVYETVLENNRLLNISSSTDAEVHRVNENITRVYSDYVLNYDISKFIKSDSINVNVHATSAAGNSDSKIKYVAVVAAYNVEESNNEYYYSINTGHSWNAWGETTTTNFNLPANATTNVTHAVLTQVATSSSKATTKLNGKQYEVVTPSNYYSENTWDVTDNIQSNNILTNTAESGSYKTTLATLTVTKEVESGNNSIPDDDLNNTTEENSTLPDDGNLGVEQIDITSDDGYTSHDTLLLNSNNNIVFTIRHLEKLTGEKYEVRINVGSKTDVTDGDSFDFRTINVSNVRPTSEGTVAYSIEFIPIFEDDDVMKINGTLKVAGLTQPVSEEFINVTNVRVTSNSNNFLAKQINNITVTLSSPENHSSVNVTLKVDDDEITQTVDNPNGTSTVVFEYTPATNGIKDVEVIINYENGTTQSSYTGQLTAYYNGYSSKSYNNEENFTVTRQYTGKYTPIIIPTTTYQSGGFNNFTHTINLADYGINDGSKIIETLYYQGYNWDNGYIVNELNLKINDEKLTPIANYNDTKGFGGWDYPSGLIVYNTTGKFNYEEEATLSYTRDIKTQVALYGGYFIIIYENATDNSNIQINEFTDLIAAGGSCYGANNTTTTIYSKNNINTESLQNMKLYTISASANEANGSLISVNNQTYTSMNKDYNSTSQVSYTETNIENPINGENIIALQSLSDNLAAYSTILYVTYEEAANIVVDNISVSSNSGNLLVGQDNIIKVDVSNTGGSITANITVDIDGTDINTEVADFTGTQSINVPYVPETNGEKTVTITVTYPDETTETLYEGSITAYYNGYMGKSFTDGENFTTQRTYTGFNTLIISPLEFYQSTKWAEFTEEYNAANNGITDQNKIVEVLYYQGYNWNNNALAIGVSINDIDTSIIANYSDTKGFANYNYPSGIIVYNATSAFKANQVNNIKITPLENNGNALYGGYLVIIYANNTDKTTIMINEGTDLLNPESNGFGANSSNTLAYSKYADVQSGDHARLYTISAAAEKNDGSIILVNDKEYTSLADNYNPVSRMSIVSVDVDNLVDGENIVVLQSTNDNLVAMGTILVVSQTIEPILVVDPINTSIGASINLTARIMFDNETANVNNGKIVFKINGKTIKDDDGKIIYAKVVNGTATIENFVVPKSWDKDGLTIEAVFSGTNSISSLRSQKVNITIVQKEFILTTNNITATRGSSITLTATLGDNTINNGKIVFKINGKTVKDDDGKIIYAKVVNGSVNVNYNIPETYKAGNYTITATYMPITGDRITANATLTVTKA